MEDRNSYSRNYSYSPLFYSPTKSKKRWFIKDGCGVFCAGITYGLVFYAIFVVSFILILPNIGKSTAYGLINGLIFGALAFLALASHFQSMTTDPGAVPKGNATKENIESLQLKPGQIVYKCAKCFSIKPERAHHCSVCKRCIRKMDHHCPWINNCVGEANQKYFVLFTLYIAAISLHALFMIVVHFIQCFDTQWHECSSFSPPATIILLITLTFESLLFFLFTLIMFCTQLHSMCYDETGIEQLKNEKHARNDSKWLNIKSVFGDKFSYNWFLPFSQPVMAKQDVYQYVV